MIWYGKHDYNRARRSAVVHWQHARTVERDNQRRLEKLYGRKKLTDKEQNDIFLAMVKKTFIIAGVIVLLYIAATC